ncbi:MAG TPA: hypothetical protein VGD79_00420 [Thermoanaerobaculia bacterium]|jgi:hypothetical protein
MKRLLAVVLFAGVAVSAEAREGFGLMKKAVEFQRTIPPATNAGARRVAIRVESERSADQDDARTLERYVTEHIVNAGGTVAEGGKPEVEVDVAIDRLESHETWETFTDYERRQTGTKREWNESKKKYEDKPVYSNVAVQKQKKVLTANLSGTWDIAAKNKDVANGSLDQDFRREYGDGDNSPAPSEIEDNLLKGAARQIAAQLVSSQESVSVLLPRASFESLIPVAESGAWDRYLTAVEAMPAKKTPKEEAYRQYALAIAKEVIGNQTEDRREALDLLRAAKSHYETAASLNSEEDLFRKSYTSLWASNNIGSPIARMTDSVTRYDAWTATAPATRVASTKSVAVPPAKSTPPPPAAGMRNQTVIDLAKAGLADDNIIMAIDAASQTQFDVSPEGLIALSKGGVSKTVIAHMQKKSKK